MQNYRKRPLIVQAEQFEYGKTPWPSGIETGHCELHDYLNCPQCKKGYVMTLEGMIAISDGDYLIIGTQGEIYPCKPNVFEEVYERVE